jgi:hypothetical protein
MAVRDVLVKLPSNATDQSSYRGKEQSVNNELGNLLNEARVLEAVDSPEYTTAPATHPNREKAQTLTVRLTDGEITRLLPPRPNRYRPWCSQPSPTNWRHNPTTEPA